MLFSGDDVMKVPIMSGGEKVRCMISRMMFKIQTSYCWTSRPITLT
jgi:ATPase subunit of ABC transporter with duplicated ATPase domains